MKNTCTIPLASIFRKEIDSRPLYGFVVAESDDLLVIHNVSDRYSLDGYLLIRRADVTSLEETFKLRDLMERALKLKKQAPVPLQALDLSSMCKAVGSVQQHFGVLIFQRERVQLDEVEVGTVRVSSEESNVLRWLTINAEWEADDRPFMYRDITMLEFGSEYAETLVAVANDRAREETLP